MNRKWILFKRADYVDLARWLKEQGHKIPNINTWADNAYQLRMDREAERTHSAIQVEDLRRRFEKTILRRFLPLIDGPREIREQHTIHPLELIEHRRGLYPLRADGWEYYSRRKQYRREIAYLCIGRPNETPYVLRVPGRCKTIGEALAAIKPAAAEKAGAKRYGPVFIAFTARARQDVGLEHLPSGFKWRPEFRTIAHPDYGVIVCNRPVAVYPAK